MRGAAVADGRLMGWDGAVLVGAVRCRAGSNERRTGARGGEARGLSERVLPRAA